jgi:cytochrome c oxidase subunit II
MRVRILTIALAVAGGVAVTNSQPAAQATEPRVVDVLARRFAFEPAQIDAVAGERLRLMVRSADGVHGVEIKKFKVKKEIPRGGEVVSIEFTASAAGTFPILCSEYCGDGHDDMAGALVVRAASASPENAR